MQGFDHIATFNHGKNLNLSYSKSRLKGLSYGFYFISNGFIFWKIFDALSGLGMHISCFFYDSQNGLGVEGINL